MPVSPKEKTIAAIGEEALLEGFGLAGVSIHSCHSDQEVLQAWTALPLETAVVILTPRSAGALAPVMHMPRSPLTVVLPA